ncbi:hypothetical protein COY05_01885 [Candidatus Peregrinibacteria bacterium CG_4_10_14_0_2_um_filter_38_24]|nr:MAG: hypothetical protein COY05_01885 [Candidatus Peregrinibacteria bacterium CG_4_10_14_0_2_um_filter_38_24]PJC38535.1 MAG: hypothetical protein CO044_04480 [Candidatus Peregrinibacteria bacterium CG_4_9_14_0_2_um_filter_38_9]
MTNETRPSQNYLGECERRLNATDKLQRSSIASTATRIATWTALILSVGLTGKLSADDDASVAGKRARASLLEALPKDANLTTEDRKTLECIVGRIGLRCRGVSRIGKDDFETQNCDKPALDKLDERDRSKESNLKALGAKAKETTKNSGFEPSFLCESSQEGTRLTIKFNESTPSEPKTYRIEDFIPKPSPTGRHKRPSRTKLAQA